MALTYFTAGCPANGVGNPGSCRAKFGLIGTLGDSAFAVTISNADLQAAFNDADVPAELKAALAAVYASQALAQAALSGGMRFDLSVFSTTSPRALGATINIDGGGLPTIDVTSAAGLAGNFGGAVVLVFNHSETR
jgi:hypothetical protein